jgi:hypothetical protein
MHNRALVFIILLLVVIPASRSSALIVKQNSPQTRSPLPKKKHTGDTAQETAGSHSTTSGHTPAGHAHAGKTAVASGRSTGPRTDPFVKQYQILERTERRQPATIRIITYRESRSIVRHENVRTPVLRKDRDAGRHP